MRSSGMDLFRTVDLDTNETQEIELADHVTLFSQGEKVLLEIRSKNLKLHSDF